MKQLADGVDQLTGFPPNAINVYLLGKVLLDAATRQAHRRIMRQISGRRVTLHVLTHAHPDHQGSSHSVCEALGIPLWCGSEDARFVEHPHDLVNTKAPRWLMGLERRFWTGSGHPVARTLSEGDQVPISEGDEIAGFTVLDTPGHSPGHIALWRESDRVLIAGDVLTNLNMLTGIPGLHEPPAIFTPDPPLNRASARRLADLRPRLTCFGHGPPLRDPGKLADFVSRLPQ